MLFGMLEGMRALVVVAAALVALARPAAADFSRTASANPHAGIHTATWQDPTIPAVLRLARIDLTSAQVQLVATKPDDRGITTSAYSARKQAAVAINGDSFSVADYQPTGLAMGEAMVWPGTSDDGCSAVFDFRRVATPTTGEYTVAELVPTGLVVTPDTLPSGTLGVISGRPLLVRNGIPETQFDCGDTRAIPCERAPRSALALSDGGNTLWLVVVDGWQQSSAGLTAGELATFLTGKLGVDMAMALDGGSSSALVVDGALVSSPSDGVERAVANHLAVQFGAQPSGAIIGLVCRKSVNPCTPISGATLTLDNGAVQTSSSSGVYNFTNISPRYACVAARASSYYPTSRCVVVGPGPNPTYDSIAMQPCPSGGCPPPDAGVIDAPVMYPDASLVDGGGRDAANPERGPGGGCCDAGGGEPPFIVCIIVAWWLVRRRVTTT